LKRAPTYRSLRDVKHLCKTTLPDFTPVSLSIRFTTGRMYETYDYATF